jgi:hypothetical protein
VDINICTTLDVCFDLIREETIQKFYQRKGAIMGSGKLKTISVEFVYGFVGVVLLAFIGALLLFAIYGKEALYAISG